MRVTERTLYATIKPVEKYLADKTVEDLKRAAENHLGGMYDLEFATFWACCAGDFSHLGDMKNPTVYQVYWCKRFADFVKEFTDTIKALQLPPTADERQASEGMLEVTFGEAMLVFMQQWFGLKSYREAERITLGDLLIAKRAAFNQDKFRRSLAAIQARKFKSKK